MPLVTQALPLVEVAAPQLRTLRITSLKGPAEESLDLFRGKTERLQQLEMTRVPLNWTSTPLTGLRILRLFDILHGTNTSQLLTVLQQCPGLEELNLRVVRLEEVHPSELPGRIELSHLRHLELEELSPPRTTTEVFSRVFTPKYQHLKLSCETEGTELVEAICHARSALSPLVSSADKLSVTIDTSGLRFTTGSVVFDIKVDSPYRILGRLIARFGEAMEGVDTYLIFTDSLNSDDQQRFYKKDFPIISNLSFVKDIYVETNIDASDLVTCLASPDIVNGVKRWPLPQLRRLNFHERNFQLSDLLDMLERRYGESTQEEQDEETEVELPAQLDDLEITAAKEHFDRLLFKEIEEIIGLECLTCLDDIQPL
ncbi:hypothetical protein FRB99_002001 [Tulasnella sp. 403]|nr:hypothetical protein FRB99_002001 [Tulasnella sp. 403]